MKSRMFLNNVTAIDGAYIDDRGAIIGDSIDPQFEVWGEVDESEKVVVDFSTIKKDIKGIIDAKYSGYDHKLWLIEGYSNYELLKNPVTGYLTVRTPYLEITAPADAFKIIRSSADGMIDKLYDSLTTELTDELRLKHPKVNIGVEVMLDDAFTVSPIFNTKAHPFRYVHGLKGSTSWGCQNIAHGHLSYLAATVENGANIREAEMLLQKISADIDGTIFVWNQNVKEITPEYISIEYVTQRGTFTMDIEGSYAEQNVIILDTETTVEFLAEAIARQYRTDLQKVGIVDLYVSEGLNKGAVINVQGE